MKNYCIIIFLLIILVPSFANAAWWNPLTWSWNPFAWFTKVPASIQQPVRSASPTDRQNTSTATTFRNVEQAQQNTTSATQIIQPKNPATSTSHQSKLQKSIPQKQASTNSKLDLNFLAMVVVKLQCGNEWGSGTIIRRDGNTATIFTNKHVVGSVNTCKIYATPGLTNSGSPPVFKWSATISSVDPTADLAMLTINNFPSSYPVLLDQNRFCNVSEYTPGQHMTIIGYPATVGGDPTQSTINISSGDIAGLAGDGLVSKSTAFIDSGSSGGAALSDSNCYFGMPTAIFYRANANELSNLGEIINIAAVINTTTFSFINLPAGNIADYVPEQQPQAPAPSQDPALKVAQCQAKAQTEKDDLVVFGKYVMATSFSGTPYIVSITPGTPAGSGLSDRDFLATLINLQIRMSQYNPLLTEREILIKYLFSGPITQEEMSQLPADVQGLINSYGKTDPSTIEIQLKIVNDEITRQSAQVKAKDEELINSAAQQAYDKTYSKCLNQ